MYITFLILSFVYSPSKQHCPTCDKLIEKLGDYRYVMRQQAMNDLQKLKSRAKPSVLLAIRTNRDPETVARCRLILCDIATAEANDLSPMPFIDAHWYNVANKSHEYISAKHAVYQTYLTTMGADDRPWENYRRASFEWVKDQLRNGVSPTFLRVILAGMHARDEVFIGQRPPRDGEKNPPVIVDWREYLKNSR